MKFNWTRSWTQPLFIFFIVLCSIEYVPASSPHQRICRPRLVSIKKGDKKVTETTVYGVPGKPFEILCKLKQPKPRKGSKKRRRKKCQTIPLSFYYENQLINETNSDVTIKRKKWNSTLIIHNFNKSNIGTYQCRIDDTFGFSKRRTQLTYHAKYSDCQPKTHSYPINMEMKRYITAKLLCSLYVVLPKECGIPAIEFFREGNPIGSSQRKYKVNGLQLQIFYFDPSDVGNYSCVYTNRYGRVHRNFSLVVVEPWTATKTIKHALLPYKPGQVNETQIYFLPKMTRDIGMVYFDKGDKEYLEAFFYVGKNMTIMKDWEVDWYCRNDTFRKARIVNFGSTRRINHTLPRYRVHSLTYMEDCPFQMNSSTCYRSELRFKRMKLEDEGTYSVLLYSNKYPNEALNFTWRVVYAKNVHAKNKIDVHVDFDVTNASVCLGQNYNLTCSVQPQDEVEGLIMRLGKNYNLAKNDFGDGHDVLLRYPTKRTNYGTLREIHYYYSSIGTFWHELKNVTFNDTSTYICAACRIETSCEEAGYSLMTLNVLECPVENIITKSIFSNKYVIVIFVVCTVTAVIIGIASCAVHIKAQRTASDRSVMKRVVISRSNANYRSANRNHNRHRSSSTNSSCGRDSNMSENSSSPLIPPRVRIHNRFVPFRQSSSRTTDSASTYDQHTCRDSDSVYYPSPGRDRILYEFPVDPPWEFSRSQLRICDLLGSGAFGTVWRGEAQDLHDQPGVTVVAVKMLNYGFDDSDLTDFVKEMEIMKIMDAHPHLIRLLATCTQNGPPMVLTEFAEHGNLKDFLRKWRRQGNWIQQEPLNLDMSKQDYCIRKQDLLTFAKQIAVGMDYLSSKSIVHRDLAARNVLVCENYCMKIADFGMTRTVHNYYKKTTDGRLPIKWLAPESLDLKKFTTKSDVWAFGILMWEIFTLGGTPYPSIPVERLFQFLRQGNRNEQPELADKEVYGIMMRCWEDNPLRRPWFTDLVFELTRRLDLTLHEDDTDYCDMMQPSTSTGRGETSPSTDYSDYPMV